MPSAWRCWCWPGRSATLALLVFTLGYLVIVLVPITFGWVIPLSPWSFLPRLVIGGSVLLLGGIGFALAQRPSRLPT